MKNFSLSVPFFVILSVMIAGSCSKKETSALQSTALEKVVLTPVENHYVTLAQATNVAKLHSMFGYVRGSGDGIHTKSQLAVMRTQAAPVAATQAVTPANDSTELYVINYADSGFVIISGDDRMPPILAYDTHGAVNLVDTLTKPSGIQDWLSSMKNKIRYCRQYHTLQDSAVKGMWKQYGHYSTITQTDSGSVNGYAQDPTTGIAMNPELPPIYISTGNCSYDTYGMQSTEVSYTMNPLLTTTWAQGDGYNNLLNMISCGLPVTGCEATSTAQLMKYLQFPNTYNWAIMPNAVDFSNINTAGAIAIQQLMRDIGAAVNMSYGCTGSSAVTGSSATALVKTFGYKSATYAAYNASTVASELEAGYPVLLRGTDNSANNAGGHQWVVDGVQVSSQVVCSIRSVVPSSPNKAEVITLGWSTLPSSSYYYFHMNWGWGSSQDGWYMDGNFNPTVIIATTPVTVHFASGLAMTYNIRH